MTPRFYFLGLPRFERDDQPAAAELGAAKAIALLAYLAVMGTPQPREKLLGLLWAESADEAARKNLRNTLWAIRKALGEDVLLTDNNRLSLAPDVWVDVREFEAARNPAEVLERYRGAFLEGLTLTEAPEYELWMAAARDRFAQMYEDVLTRLVDERRTVGAWQDVIPLARRALAHDPLREPMHRALIEAYAHIGERAEALRQYDMLKATLSSELGVEPLPETETLRTAVLNGTLKNNANGAGITDSQTMLAVAAATVPRNTPRPPGDAPRSPYIGRTTERDALTEAYHAAFNAPRIVLLTGEIGIGKSRLWKEWSASLPTTQPVLETRCLASTQALPFAPLVELFSTQQCATTLFESKVAPMWIAEIARLFPEIRAFAPDLPPPAALPPDEERRHIFEAFTQWLFAMRNLNPGLPLVLFIDDLHWADRALLDWLDYVTHRFNASNNMQGLLLVCAYRPDDAPTALIHRTAGWIREGLAQRVALERLTIEESAALMQSLGGDASLSKQLQDQSSGNPLFLIELCRAAPGIIPPTLSELITVRLDRLGDAARQVLQASAVLEADFGFATLAKVSGRSEDEMLDALDELLNADVLSERAGRYAFVHPVVAAVVEQSFSGARRAVLHRRAAAAREAEYATRLPQIAGRLAMHYTHADDPAKAAFYADMAGEHALSLAAISEAAAFFRKALQLQPNPERRMKLGRVVYMQGELAEARRIFTEALYAFKASGDRLNIARAYLSIADSYLPSGAFDQVTHWVYEACAVLDTTANPEEYARAEFLLGASRLSESLSDAERHLRTATRIAAENNIADMAAQSRFELGNLYAERGELDSARAAYREAIALSREAGSPVQEALAHNNAAYHALLAGDLEEAHHEVQAGLALAEQSALRLPLQYLYSTRGEMALAEGKWRDAQDWFNKGMAEAEYAGNTRQVVNYVANLGLAARGSGDLDSALISLQSARDMAKTLNVPHLRTQIDLWLAELHIQRHEHAAALESLAQAEARLTDTQRRGLREWTERLRAQL